MYGKARGLPQLGAELAGCTYIQSGQARIHWDIANGNRDARENLFWIKRL